MPRTRAHPATRLYFPLSWLRRARGSGRSRLNSIAPRHCPRRASPKRTRQIVLAMIPAQARTVSQRGGNPCPLDKTQTHQLRNGIAARTEEQIHAAATRCRRDQIDCTNASFASIFAIWSSLTVATSSPSREVTLGRLGDLLSADPRPNATRSDSDDVDDSLRDEPTGGPRHAPIEQPADACT